MKLANTLSAILFCLCTNTALAVCNPQDEITFNGFVYRCVTSPDTGRIWLDRNLGASRVATSVRDAASYGYLYQWGRSGDGHEIVQRNADYQPTSETTETQSRTITPDNDGKFITKIFYASNGRYIGFEANWATVDEYGAERRVAWASGGVNSVCPPSYRVPTLVELRNDTIRASTNKVVNPDAAFASFLKLTLAGDRVVKDKFEGGRIVHKARVLNSDTWGTYWSSTTSHIDTAKAFTILFNSQRNIAYDGGSPFYLGHSVRCIFDSEPNGIGAGIVGAELFNTTTDQNVSTTLKINVAPNSNPTYGIRLAGEIVTPTVIVATSNNNAVKINGSTTYSLKFTDRNWSEAQIITVDTSCAGESATITHSIFGNDDYKDIVVPTVTVTISGQYNINIEDAKSLTQYLFGTREQSLDTTVANIMTCGESSIPDFDLDVDKNNEVNTKDGTLILRHRLGADCPTLTANQTDSNCVDVKDAIELLLE